MSVHFHPDELHSKERKIPNRPIPITELWSRVREIVLSLAGHFNLFVGHLIGFNYGSLPDIFKICWTCPASPANFAYSALEVH